MAKSNAMLPSWMVERVISGASAHCLVIPSKLILIVFTPDKICIFVMDRSFAGVKNPIEVAHSILEHSRRPDTLGRIPPMFVCDELAVSILAHKRHDNPGHLSPTVLMHLLLQKV
jgi:hypothetical protein